MKFIITLLLFSIFAFAADTAPIVNLSVSGINEPAQFVKTINITLILTLMVLAPTLILMVTSFTRLIIVFSLLRQAMGLQQTPPTQIVISLSLILTIFIMEPYGKKSWEEGIKPYMDEKIGYEVAFQKGIQPFKEFMIKNWEQINQIDLHDWFIYAYSRENNYKWHIDEKPSMRYRQHTSNQVGANDGLKAKLKRLKKVFSSWYREEIIKIIKVLRLENKYKFSKYILNKSYLNNLLLLKYSFEFRRNKKEKLLLSLLILLGIF